MGQGKEVRVRADPLRARLRSTSQVDMEHEAMVAIAETILSAVFSPGVRLKLGEIVQDNAISTLLRCTCLTPSHNSPHTVILKHPNRHEAAVFHEWAGLKFIQTRANIQKLAPQLYGHDESTKVLVMEDLGPSHSQLLRNMLTASDRERAIDALLAFQRALGALHANTIGQHAAYTQIRSCYPNPMHSRHMIHHFDKILDTFLGLPQRLGCRILPGFRQEVNAARFALVQSGPFLALTHGDTTPLNAFYMSSGRICLYDWEACDFRHALLDGVYAHIRYMHSYVAMDIPKAVQNRMYEAYREALVSGCPPAADDTVFRQAYLACCLAWLAGACGVIPHVYETDQLWGMSTWRQRIMKCLNQFIDLSQAWGLFSVVSETCQHIEQVLQDQWQDTDNRLPLYPAFTQ
jgi:hypothetical protein